MNVSSFRCLRIRQAAAQGVGADLPLPLPPFSSGCHLREQD
jgi:hypothetical protein